MISGHLTGHIMILGYKLKGTPFLGLEPSKAPG